MSMVIRERTLEWQECHPDITAIGWDIARGATQLLHLVAGIEATFAGLHSAWSGDNHAPLTTRR